MLVPDRGVDEQGVGFGTEPRLAGEAEPLGGPGEECGEGRTVGAGEIKGGIGPEGEKAFPEAEAGFGEDESGMEVGKKRGEWSAGGGGGEGEACAGNPGLKGGHGWGGEDEVADAFELKEEKVHRGWRVGTGSGNPKLWVFGGDSGACCLNEKRHRGGK
jgi:hypothetical protein